MATEVAEGPMEDQIFSLFLGLEKSVNSTCGDFLTEISPDQATEL
jgi:hypothetical protein